MMRLHSLELNKINIKDDFWSKHIDLVREVILPYQWEVMNDRIEGAESSHCLDNFRIAAGRAKGEFYGVVFQDTDVAKWLEAVGFSLSCYKDEELEKTADEVIDLIAKAQCADGYLNTYFTIKEPGQRWRYLCEGHELYTAGHFMEAATAYYKATGKRKLLDCICRFADLICDTFGYEDGKIHGYPGHQEAEIGLIKIYEVTGEKKYLDQAKYFIDARGMGENYFLKEMHRKDYHLIFPEFVNYEPQYSQSHMPVREQKTAEGHAVRAVYMLCAMADLAYAYKDKALIKACKALWNNITKQRMYITGGIGSSGILERFTTDYDLPNEYNYSESCASIGLALFGLRMNQITRDSSYMDVAERALYNTILSGIALDGKSFFYVNPLEVWPTACMPRTSKGHVKPIRQKWFGVACCPTNIARTLASLGQYIYGADEENGQLYVNLFVSNEVEIKFMDAVVSMRLKTRFPVENKMGIQVLNVPKEGMTLAVRIPDYAKDYKITVDNTLLTYEIEKGYAIIKLQKSCFINVMFEAPARFMRANPSVRPDVGKVAITRGPMVYCLEEVDNGENLSAVFVDTSKELTENAVNKLGGIVEITAKGQRVSREGWGNGLYKDSEFKLEPAVIKAVPYCYWNNRGAGEMAVWIKELI